MSKIELKAGDRVAWTRQFLQATQDFTYATAQRRGTIEFIRGEFPLAHVLWDDGARQRINPINLVRADRIHLEAV